MKLIFGRINDRIDDVYLVVVGRIKKNIYNNVEMTVFDIPLTYDDIPLWNVIYASNQIIKRLREDGYDVVYKEPNTIYVTYQSLYDEYHKEIERSKEELRSEKARYLRMMRSQKKRS